MKKQKAAKADPAMQAPAEVQKEQWNALMKQAKEPFPVAPCRTAASLWPVEPDGDELMKRAYPNVGDSIPGLLKAILKELLIMRHGDEHREVH